MKRFCICLVVSLIALSVCAHAEEASTLADDNSPALIQMDGIGMPSVSEAIGCYPDQEMNSNDGGRTELYKNVTVSNFNLFSEYLNEQQASLVEYTVEEANLTATVQYQNAVFYLSYNMQTGDVSVTYPSGTFNGQLQTLKTHYQRGEELLLLGDIEGASVEFEKAEDYRDAAERIPQYYYVEGEKLLASGMYDEAVEVFTKAGSYSDAAYQVQSAYYAKGEVLLSAGDYDNALTAFGNASNYSDASECVLKTWYAKAESLLSNGDYDGAINAFIKAGNYSDAEGRISEVRYAKGEELFESKDYDGAIEEFKKAGDYRDSDQMILECQYQNANQSFEKQDYNTAARVFEELAGYKDASDKAIESIYKYAIELFEKGEYANSIGYFEKTNGYLDSNEQIDKAKKKAHDALIEPFKQKFNTIQFGGYDWTVLDVKKDKCLLFSEKLEKWPLHSDSTEKVTWETCSLRKRMKELYQKMQYLEKNAIIETKTGKEKDYVFILSKQEVERLLPGDKRKGIDGRDSWWTRTMASKGSKEAYYRAYNVDSKGKMNYPIDTDQRCWIHAAMWIDLNAEYFWQF